MFKFLSLRILRFLIKRERLSNFHLNSLTRVVEACIDFEGWQSSWQIVSKCRVFSVLGATGLSYSHLVQCMVIEYVIASFIGVAKGNVFFFLLFFFF